MRRNAWIAALAGAALLMAGQVPAQEDPTEGASAGGSPGEAEKLSVELNKLESFEGGCRSFFLFRNRTEITLSAFEMSLAILDRAGVIDRLLTIDAAPLPALRTTLKIFEVPEIACGEVGELILHDIASCASQSDAGIDCFDLIELSSRASSPLMK